MPSDDKSDNLYRVYVWDVVDMFFATIVAPLPVLNDVIGASIARLKTWAWMSSTSLFGRFSTFGASSQHSRGYTSRLLDREAGKSLGNFAARGTEPLSSDQIEEPTSWQQGEMELQRPAKPYRKAF